MRLSDLVRTEEQEPEGLDRLTPSQQKAISALLVSRTYCEAAEAVGVDRTTIYRWIRQDKAFRSELARARLEALALTTARLQLMTVGAVDELENIVKNKDASASTRVSGIRTVLDYAYRAVELEEIEDRLVEVEDAIKKYGPQRSGY